MCSWFYWPLTLKYWTEGNEPEKIFMSKKVEQLSHSQMWNQHHRTMVIWRSKQSKEQYFLESIQMISKPGLILFEMMSHQFILQLRLKYAQKIPILCARTYEILSKQFKNESCVREWVCVGQVSGTAWSNSFMSNEKRVLRQSAVCGAGELMHRRYEPRDCREQIKWFIHDEPVLFVHRNIQQMSTKCSNLHENGFTSFMKEARLTALW